MEGKDLLYQTLSLFKDYMDIIEGEFKRTGISHSEARLMVEIDRNCNISQKELAGQLGITPATLSPRLKRLEKLGLIKRSHNQEDSRRIDVVLTEQGKQSMQKGKDCFDELSKRLTGIFTKQQIQEYIDMTHTIQKTLKGEENE